MLEIAIVGGGPAGLTAGLYARRAGCSCALFEAGFPGGQQATTDRVENYPGFPGGVGGPELSAAMQAQAEAFGLEIRFEAVERVELDGPVKRLYGPGGVTEARAVILAMGATPKPLGVPGEEAFRGRGVSYCATCDGAFYRGKDVAVVGGGDTAAEDALYLSRFARTVTLLHRRDRLRALRSLAERLEQTSNVQILYNAQTLSIEGENAVTGLTYRDKMSGEERLLPVSGVFVAVGTQPGSELVRGQLDTDENGYILAGEDTRCSLPLVYAAGDIRQKPLRQIVCAASDGAVAASMAVRDLEAAEAAH